MRSGITFIAIMITLITGCKKPVLDNTPIESLPITFSTSLRDTLPVSTFASLGIQDVQGVRLLDLDGTDVRYFEYEIEPEKLLKALSLSGFSINAFSADTVSRKLENGTLHESQFMQFELAYASSFTGDAPSTEIYEVIKPPLRHLLAVNRATDRVLHRISNF